jgi:Sushi repeat (SCR repeat)
MCGRPGSPQNGTFVYENDNSVNYTCDEGFVISGDDKTRRCVNGLWTGNVPHCGESTLKLFEISPLIKLN